MNKVTTLEALVDAYIRERMLRPDTERTYREAIRLWKRDTGINALSRIDRDAVLDWRNAVAQRVRPVTVNKYRRHLGVLANFAVKQKWMKDNPFASVDPAPESERLPKVVEVEVIRRALALLSKPDDEAATRLTPGWFWSIVVRFLYYTGVRRRQLVGLRWDDISFDAKYLLLRSEIAKTRREWKIPLNAIVIADLRDLWARFQKARHRMLTPEEQVFIVDLFRGNQPAEEMAAPEVTNFFQYLSRELGQRISAHRLRHSMATALGPAGDIRTLQHILGHRSARTTMVYIHPDMEHARQLIERLPDLPH